MAFKPLLLLLLISSLPLISSRSELHDYPPLADGLAWDFYDGTCHELESIVRGHLRSVFDTDVGLAAGLLRVFFHDCFVQVLAVSCHLLVVSTKPPFVRGAMAPFCSPAVIASKHRHRTRRLPRYQKEEMSCNKYHWNYFGS
ncbi:hypothetical protein BHE74_00046796 [Ensete ventricosum]|nr:hypothetical protein BHE74_00046796 [Ensete ventricosum]RZS18726.1 hypothetical protein BHM03_00051052 [Ensete ventricosum]